MTSRLSFGWHLAWVLGWLLVLAAGAWLRLTQLGDQILMDDEWHALHRLMHADYRAIFLSFGHADYSIPLTLLFKFLAESTSLTEWRMRSLPVLAGLATLVVVPWLLRPWLKKLDRLLLAALLALSPVLIYFSRYVRPYSLTVLLGFVAVISLWRWWHEGDRRWLWGFIPATVLSAWLHPLTLLFTGGALSWFGVLAIYQWLGERNPAGLQRIVPVGLITAGLTSVLILPPLLVDPAAMSSKTGVHSLQMVTAIRAWEFIAGTSSWLVAGPMLVLALAGGVVMYRRNRAFVLHWLYLTILAVAAIFLLNPAWVHHPMVPVRYLSVALPMVLALAAVGLIAILDVLGRRLGRPAGQLSSALIVAALFAALILSGPLTYTYGHFNQFTTSPSFHFDYRYARSPYLQAAQAAPMPDVYRAMVAEPGDWLLIEGPWHYEGHYSPLFDWQRQHGLPIRIGMISGMCAEWTLGELRQVEGQRLRLRHFVPFANLPWVLADTNRFVVLHRTPPMPWARALPPVEECREQLVERLGEPWYEDEHRTVFRLEQGQFI